MNSERKPAPWVQIHEELGIEAPDIDNRPLGKFIEHYAETIPDNDALRYFERGISYRELNELANRLANALVTLGVERNDVVSVYTCPTFHST